MTDGNIDVAQERIGILRNAEASHLTGQNHPELSLYPTESDSEPEDDAITTATAPAVGKHTSGRDSITSYLV